MESEVWNLESGVWSLEPGIWNLKSGAWRDKFRLELSAISEGGTESDLISKGEIDAERKPTG